MGVSAECPLNTKSTRCEAPLKAVVVQARRTEHMHTVCTHFKGWFDCEPCRVGYTYAGGSICVCPPHEELTRHDPFAMTSSFRSCFAHTRTLIFCEPSRSISKP